MHLTSLRLAQSISTKPLNLREASAQIYPPIPFVVFHFPPYKRSTEYKSRLFRRLLRAHRNLPLDMRTLGDDYVKSGKVSCLHGDLSPSMSHSEYRRHRSTTNPLHIIGFLSQWKVYLEQLPTSKDGGVFKGKKLDTTVFEKVGSCYLDWYPACLTYSSKMSSEQIGQLYELMHATKDVWKPLPRDKDGKLSNNA